MITRHPDNSFLLEYASGSLPLAPCIAVTTHLQFCDVCRADVDSLNSLGGELLNSSDEAAVSAELLDNVLACLDEAPQTEISEPTQRDIDDIATELPDYVQHLLPNGPMQWRTLSPSLKVTAVPVGETRNELALHRIKAGGKAPEHDHHGRELTVVLTGSFSDEDGIYQEGDFMVREPGDIHRPQAARHTECVCLSVLEAPIKLTGIKRVLNPFMRFTPA